MPEIPDHAPVPQDHKSAKSEQARQAEADGFLLIEQCGVQLKVPVAGKVPLKAFAAFKKGDELLGTELLLGAEQWEEFMACEPTVADFAEIGEKLVAVMGE